MRVSGPQTEGPKNLPERESTGPLAAALLSFYGKHFTPGVKEITPPVVLFHRSTTMNCGVKKAKV
jgi:hypothetical protein